MDFYFLVEILKLKNKYIQFINHKNTEKQFINHKNTENQLMKTAFTTYTNGVRL